MNTKKDRFSIFMIVVWASLFANATDFITIIVSFSFMLSGGIMFIVNGKKNE